MFLSRLLGDEDGAVLVVFALILVVLLLFAAVAVDLAAAFAGRRGAQAGADIAALSGAQEAIGRTAADALAAVETEVRRISAVNLETTDADWAACADPDRPPGYVLVAPTTACVSATAVFDRIRVRVPDRSIPTAFARVIGMDVIDVSAAAEVELAVDALGDILPLGLTVADAGETVVCMSDLPGGHATGVAECDGPTQGNFNRLDISHWGNSTLGTTRDCTFDNDLLAENIALGADHVLGIDNDLVDQDLCQDGPNATAFPAVLQRTSTGVQSGPLTEGLVTGTRGGFPGRLTDTSSSVETGTLRSYTLDDSPLWEFIPTGLGNAIPASCTRESFGGGEHDWDRDLWIEQGLDPDLDDPDPLEDDRSYEHMARCLRDYDAGAYSTPLFTVDSDGDPDNERYDLQRSPRWGWAPVGTSFGPGAASFRILDYVPVYLDTVLGNCTAAGCSFVWSASTPGIPSLSGSINTFAKGLVAFRLPAGSVPQEIIDGRPGGPETIEYVLYR